MALQASGQIKFSEIATEFGASPPYLMSQFVRGGSKVPQAGANSNIPETASNMRFNHFYGAVNVIAVTASNGTNVSAQSLFGSSWTDNVPKELIIPSGVTLGATSTSNFALTIEGTLVGTLTVKNSGSIQGAGGAAGANGGDAIDANATVTIINNSGGTIYAGGGGGGTGGTGGQGSYSGTVNKGSASAYIGASCQDVCCGDYQYVCWTNHGGTRTLYSPSGISKSGSCNVSVSVCNYPGTIYTNGGSGGGGGVGQGYGQSATSGSAGSAGGTNAGSGGTGGTGGAFGSSGNTGNTGANGNSSNGSSGSSGGSAGRYINGIANVTLTNNGTVAGGTV